MNRLLQDMLDRAEKRAKDYDNHTQATCFIGGEIFDRASEIATRDYELTHALLQEMSAVLSNDSDLCEQVIENLKEWHSELFNED